MQPHIFKNLKLLIKTDPAGYADFNLTKDDQQIAKLYRRGRTRHKNLTGCSCWSSCLKKLFERPSWRKILDARSATTTAYNIHHLPVRNARRGDSKPPPIHCCACHLEYENGSLPTSSVPISMPGISLSTQVSNTPNAKHESARWQVARRGAHACTSTDGGNRRI